MNWERVSEEDWLWQPAYGPGYRITEEERRFGLYISDCLFGTFSGLQAAQQAARIDSEWRHVLFPRVIQALRGLVPDALLPDGD